MELSWDFPEECFVKVNVRAFTLAEPLPTGNDSGIGIVIRDRTGSIVKWFQVQSRILLLGQTNCGRY